MADQAPSRQFALQRRDRGVLWKGAGDENDRRQDKCCDSGQGRGAYALQLIGHLGQRTVAEQLNAFHCGRLRQMTG